jgi:hypothetical protein
VAKLFFISNPGVPTMRHYLSFDFNFVKRFGILKRRGVKDKDGIKDPKFSLKKAHFPN